MKRITAAVVLMLATVAAGVAAPGRDGKRWWSFVEMLANDDMQGRDTGSAAHRKAADLVATEFQRAGLAPAGVTGSIQPVKFSGRTIVEAETSLELVRNGKAEKLTLGEDAVINLRINPADAVEAPLVFAGYGLTVPDLNYNDLAGLDLKGKILVVLAGGPSTIPGPLRSHFSYPIERQKFLEQAGAVGLITIQNPRTDDVPWARSALARFQESMSLADQDLVDYKSLKLGATINAAHADKWLAGSGHTTAELLDLVTAGKPLPRFPLVPSLRARVKVIRRDIESQNVVGIRPGSDPTMKNDYVVLSAHLDHVGVGEPIDGDEIYNGAMDDASGVAAILEIANELNQEKVTTKRSLLFVAVTGEEKGLLGSRYFTAHPTVDAKRMVADLNMDMFLPLYPFKVLTVYGLNESDLGDAIRTIARPMNLQVQDDPEPVRNIFVRSDQYNFIRHGVPAVMTDIGNLKGSKEAAIEKAWLDKRYHAPSDDLNQPIDLQAAADYVEFMRRLTLNVADAPAKPQWKPDSFFRRFQ
jgi:peptidase M28-like protein